MDKSIASEAGLDGRNIIPSIFVEWVSVECVFIMADLIITGACVGRV